uniref:Peptidase S1 domain-containing protein n=1 Tax=Mustela putorius furo TaxID=9669 RepID=M3YWE6_MUSPF
PLPIARSRESCLLHSRGWRKNLEAGAFRVPVGQLRLYDHDQLYKVAEIICHPRFNESLSVRTSLCWDWRTPWLSLRLSTWCPPTTSHLDSGTTVRGQTG